MVNKNRGIELRKNLELKIKFLEYYRNLPIQKLAAKFIGVHENTILNWKAKDKEFCDQIGMAKSQWVLIKTQKVRPEWLLERLINDHFGKKQKADSPINEELEAALERLKTILP